LILIIFIFLQEKPHVDKETANLEKQDNENICLHCRLFYLAESKKFVSRIFNL
jgi:hypothetical protein